MKLTSSAFQDKQFMPATYCAGLPDEQAHATLGPNKNPPLAWTDLPEGTQSLVMICVDLDVPSAADDVNQEDREVPADLPRVDFYHWVMVDLPANLSAIEEGLFSDGFTAGGKPGPEGPLGTRHGINNYREWFGDDPDMGGKYYGYDGPFPPWNDSIMHNYRFTLYALDVARCPVEGDFTGADVLAAIEGHVLDSASISVQYTLNPRLR
ncbi:YbhB/YbcL family Raf kinase inhibitor-like protein [Spongiibacter taiwanensis]|uniref:YbhB/YbcL family Raf kinase inhibitor-like protein n=1 Tax=Spongiibacter taiwanensis TaxID=1748242 RepID=UPI002035994B|nr:YbhB/YbcL family Raf kinase inhibitor-like protein [Spongiibacter taiwanensis]USA42534.1 YbhB/YbcL family Raf kinase inhibitor-like protein [Spongiibacter taiwanensis]